MLRKLRVRRCAQQCRHQHATVFPPWPRAHGNVAHASGHGLKSLLHLGMPNRAAEVAVGPQLQPFEAKRSEQVDSPSQRRLRRS